MFSPNLWKTIDMKQCTVFITDKAQADMENIYLYIAYELCSPETAVKQYKRIADEINKLNFFPERYGVIDIIGTNLKQLRRMKADNYSIIYCIIGNRVYVTNVLYSASDLANRLN